MNELTLIFGMAVVTFAVRYPPLTLIGRLELPEHILRALRFVPVAVLTAIIVPAIVIQKGELALSLTNAYLVAGIAAIVISRYSKNLLLTIVLGMAIFLAWRGITGV